MRNANAFVSKRDADVSRLSDYFLPCCILLHAPQASGFFLVLMPIDVIVADINHTFSLLL